LYKIPANTLFLGKNLISVPECHSTNTLVADLASQSDMPEGSLVITNNQTAGRGQRGNTWQAEPGKNFTFSILLKPRFLSVKDQFFLHRFVSLGLTDYLQHYFTEGVTIKWPNDILINSRKVCGILIENQLSGFQINQSIIGIGLNVNQKQFGQTTATSLSLLTRMDFSLETELAKLLMALEVRYMQLKNNKLDLLKEEYLRQLHWRNEQRTFTTTGKDFSGKIIGTDETGRLQIESTEGIRTFDVKEITYLN
jgi:BirA family transcriptional regulator, biotin operon repressor / biotin---[acetyl-CoA-carboxylase] ligase